MTSTPAQRRLRRDDTPLISTLRPHCSTVISPATAPSLSAPISAMPIFWLSRLSPESTIPSPGGRTLPCRLPGLFPILMAKGRFTHGRFCLRRDDSAIRFELPAGAGRNRFRRYTSPLRRFVRHREALLIRLPRGSYPSRPRGQQFQLGPHPASTVGPSAVEGRADFVLKGSGTADAPTLNADVHMRALTLDHELAGNVDLQIANLRQRSSSLWQVSAPEQGSLVLERAGSDEEDYPAKIPGQMDRVDLDAVWRSYLKGRVTGHSAISGSMQMSGPMRHFDQWTVNGDLSAVALDVENVKLHNQDAIQFSLANQSIKIQKLHMIGEGTDFAAHGLHATLWRTKP